MQLCACMHAYTQTHTRIRIHVHIYTHTHTHLHMYTQSHFTTHTHTPIMHTSMLIDPFLAHVKTLMGNTYPVWMRPSELVMDLKEKVYLQQGIPVCNQKLFYNNCEIGDGFSMQACNISLGSTVHIVLTGSSTLEAQHHSSNAFSAPLMTISHLQLSLGLERLESAFGGVPSAVPPAPIPPQVTHVVHVHDVPCDGLRLFLQYLYTGRLNGYNG